MKRLGISTDKELAELAETYPPVICNWLGGKNPLSKTVGRKVAEVLGVSLEKVLFDWAPAPPKRRLTRLRRKAR